MPRLSVYFIRASLIYSVLGFTVGGLLLANKGIMYFPALWNLLPLHIELAFMGWMVQLTMGMAFWILPRFSNEFPRGNETLVWASFILINVGIFFVGVYSLFAIQGFAFIGRAVEFLGLAAFAVGNWKRIKPLEAKTRAR
ncbi:MAG: hypothetical protein HKUEN02_06420 [Anaerolineaceae bacterium]|nr:MAG: hypothetical protein HKUEN02_06420 [Anaerolineaceae bacterium]